MFKCVGCMYQYARNDAPQILDAEYMVNGRAVCLYHALQEYGPTADRPAVYAAYVKARQIHGHRAVQP